MPNLSRFSGIDLCKALVVTDYIVREFFPRLLLGALVLQQDFVHEFHPHIHLSMLRLRDFFDPFVEFRWGGTVAYRLRKTISKEDVVAVFGNDSSWFNDVATNTELLRQMIDEIALRREPLGLHPDSRCLPCRQ